MYLRSCDKSIREIIQCHTNDFKIKLVTFIFNWKHVLLLFTIQI